MNSLVISVLYVTIGVMFTAGALASVYRVVRGPSLIDRVIASDVLLTTLLLAAGAEMVYNGHTRSVPLMVALAATAVLGSIAVARHVSPKDSARANP